MFSFAQKAILQQLPTASNLHRWKKFPVQPAICVILAWPKPTNTWWTTVTMPRPSNDTVNATTTSYHSWLAGSCRRNPRSRNCLLICHRKNGIQSIKSSNQLVVQISLSSNIPRYLSLNWQYAMKPTWSIQRTIKSTNTMLFKIFCNLLIEILM